MNQIKLKFLSNKKIDLEALKKDLSSEANELEEKHLQEKYKLNVVFDGVVNYETH